MSPGFDHTIDGEQDSGRTLANLIQLAKASTLALISMLVIIVTVITQGARIDPELRGDVKGFLGIKSGIFQAIGVISFGKDNWSNDSAWLT